MTPKAAADDFLGRFREIISDPLNLLIPRFPSAGIVTDGLVALHNGHLVPITGIGSYYDKFSEILIVNRGVHEPLEEYVFQELIKTLPISPSMVELGSYWAHYSMWLKKVRPDASVTMVEPEPINLRAGVNNFKLNGYEGVFVKGLAGSGSYVLDRLNIATTAGSLDVLHSDIQGHEVELLKESAAFLINKSINYLFISTHSEILHREVTDILSAHGYRIEVSSSFDFQTTSFDGFVFASSPQRAALFPHFEPLGREEIVTAQPETLVRSISSYVARASTPA